MSTQPANQTQPQPELAIPRRRRIRTAWLWLFPSLALLLFAAFLSDPPIGVTGSTRHLYFNNLLTACILSVINISIWAGIAIARLRARARSGTP